MNNFKRHLFGALYSLSFGLKAINDLILTQKISSNSDDLGVSQNLKQINLKNDLLKGEVTQAVEELRYSTYTVSNESKKYEYIGDGKAIKKEDEIKEVNVKNFSLVNKLICEDVYHEMKHIEKNGEERYVVSFIYKNIVKFKLEQFLTLIEVKIDNDDCLLTLHFNSTPDKYNVKSKPFTNTLSKIISTSDRRNEILTDIEKISFITYKANGEEDLIKYEFNDPSHVSYSIEKHEFILSYRCTDFKIVDLIEKYDSITMKNKYKNKERKNTTLDLTNYF